MKLIVTETIRLEFDIKPEDEAAVRENPTAWYCARTTNPAEGFDSLDVLERECEIEPACKFCGCEIPPGRVACDRCCLQIAKEESQGTL